MDEVTLSQTSQGTVVLGNTGTLAICPTAFRAAPTIPYLCLEGLTHSLQQQDQAFQK